MAQGNVRLCEHPPFWLPTLSCRTVIVFGPCGMILGLGTVHLSLRVFWLCLESLPHRAPPSYGKHSFPGVLPKHPESFPPVPVKLSTDACGVPCCP